MKTQKLTLMIIFICVISVFLFAALQEEGSAQKSAEKKLSPKYQAFLEKTRLIMTPQEREVFLMLSTNRDRDLFIESFWKARQKRDIRDSISTLMLLRMTQVLNLTEDQAAKIFPTMNRIEKEKRQIQGEIGKCMKSLRKSLKQEVPNAEELENQLKELKRLRNILRDKDQELESFLEENLSIIQRARYMLFSVDFYRGLREKLQRARALQKEMKHKEN